MTEPGAGGGPPALFSRVCGGSLVLAATVLVALVESFLVPLRVGTVRVPVSVALAVICHPLLSWLMRAATESRAATLGPFVVWLAVVLSLGRQRAEADLVLTSGNWVATILVFGGSLIFAVSLGLLLAAPRRSPGSLGHNGSA